MVLGITSIQRDRGPWIVEWLAFHMMIGIDRFFIYVHNTNDGMTEVLVELSRHYPIEVVLIGGDRPQLQAYRSVWDRHGNDVDWMAFIDGDEFLFSPQYLNTWEPNRWDIKETITAYEDKDISAIGVYWMHYGSNGHIQEPEGLIIENYPRHANNVAAVNYHIKSIVRGKQEIGIRENPHGFNTEKGTFTEHLRPVHMVFITQEELDNGILPTHSLLRLNHYATQSYEYFKNTKQYQGYADLSPHGVRPDKWFFDRDRNECDDGMMYNLLAPLKLKIRELQSHLSEPVAQRVARYTPFPSQTV